MYVFYALFTRFGFVFYDETKSGVPIDTPLLINCLCFFLSYQCHKILIGSIFSKFKIV